MKMNKAGAALVALHTVVVLFTATLLATLKLTGDKDTPLAIKIKNFFTGHGIGDSLDEDTRLARQLYKTTQCESAPMPIKRGSVGYEVELLQRHLNVASRANILEDGHWGGSTEKAIATLTGRLRRSGMEGGMYWSEGPDGYIMDMDQFTRMLTEEAAALLK